MHRNDLWATIAICAAVVAIFLGGLTAGVTAGEGQREVQKVCIENGGQVVEGSCIKN